jgi:DNA-binding beta-propeller fold protein YncE
MTEKRSYDYKDYWIEVTVQEAGGRFEGIATIFVSRDSAWSGGAPAHRVLTGGSTESDADSAAATRLDSPQGVAVDNTHHELVVSNDGRLSILVFDRLADGNVAPLREIFGSNTLITTPEGLVVDPVHNEIILADEGDPEASPVIPPKLLVFDRTANGNVAPKRVITGLSTGLIRPRQLQLDTERDELVLADRGLPQEFVFTPATQGYIGFWERTASGDTPPKRVIRGPRSQLSSPRAVYVDIENDEIGAGDTTSRARRLESLHHD